MNTAIIVTAMICLTVLGVVGLLASVAKITAQSEANQKAAEMAETLCKISEIVNRAKTHKEEIENEQQRIANDQ